MAPTAKAFARAPRCSPYESDRMPACDGRGQRAREVLTTAAASAEDSAHSTAQVTTNAWHERLQRTQSAPPSHDAPAARGKKSDSEDSQAAKSTYARIERPRQAAEKSSESQQKKSPAGPQVRPSTRAHDFFLPGNATVSSPRPRPLRHPSPAPGRPPPPPPPPRKARAGTGAL